MRIQQLVVLPMVHDLLQPLEPVLREFRNIGFAGVEIWDRSSISNFGAMVATIRDCGLKLVNMGGHGSLNDGLNRRENHERIAGELHESITVAAQYDISGLICFSGDRHAGQSDYAGMVACAEVLRRVAPYAEQKGVNLNVELLNSRVDHYNYMADHTDWGVALCEMVGSPRVKLLYDIYHMQIMEGDVIGKIRSAIRHIGHFHTAGNPGRRDIDDAQELNYRGICKAIAESGYNLYVGHEFQPKGDLVAALRQAFTICDQQ